MRPPSSRIELGDDGDEEAGAAALGILHVGAEVQPAAEDEHEPERGRDQRVHVAGEQQDRGHEDDQLLEGVHLHAEVALEHLVAGGGRGGHLVGVARPADGVQEHEELHQGECDHQMN